MPSLESWLLHPCRHWLERPSPHHMSCVVHLSGDGWERAGKQQSELKVAAANACCARSRNGTGTAWHLPSAAVPAHSAQHAMSSLQPHRGLVPQKRHSTQLGVFWHSVQHSAAAGLR